ncbi:TetR/AcrR family transcriptional regulator [Kribbella sp. DT2]|uniref:TetR/AcrR family transcriptional regulator n=1 Tax=Kribbella sp. DT2 TaxID=3393427 RepID=UPI003CFB9EA9
MPATEATRPKLRKDAQKSVEKLTAAAIELFAERGLSCPLDEIAHRAGVSRGTLYHRFGSREALIDAVVPDLAAAKLDRVLAHAESQPDPWARFVDYVEKISEMIAGDLALSDAVTRRIADTPRLSAVCEAAIERGNGYARAAQAVGELRADFTPEDFILLFTASTAHARAAADGAPEIWRRGLAFMLDGLRATAASPLPVEPLSPANARAALHSG